MHTITSLSVAVTKLFYHLKNIVALMVKLTKFLLILSPIQNNSLSLITIVSLTNIVAHSSLTMEALSRAIPITFRPLSTYKVVPVMARARGESRKAADAPTSSE